MKFYKSFAETFTSFRVSLWWVGTYQYFISDLCKKMGFVLKLQDKEQVWCPCLKSSCKCSRVQFSSLMFLIILTGLNLLFESLSFFCSTHVFLLNLLPVPYVFVPLSRHLVWLCLMACSKWLSRLGCGGFPKGSQGFTRLLSYLFRISQLKW